MEVIKREGKVRGFSMTESEYKRHDSDYDGLCLSCGKLAVGGVEPDARGCECEICSEPKVYGIAELLVMGRIKITE